MKRKHAIALSVGGTAALALAAAVIGMKQAEPVQLHGLRGAASWPADGQRTPERSEGPVDPEVTTKCGGILLPLPLWYRENSYWSRAAFLDQSVYPNEYRTDNGATPMLPVTPPLYSAPDFYPALERFVVEEVLGTPALGPWFSPGLLSGWPR
jgi:hypothetical protein